MTAALLDDTDRPLGHLGPRREFTAIDLFSGAGGATQGLRDAGFDVIGAIEFDEIAAASYAMNHPSTSLWRRDIRTVSATGMRQQLGLAKGELTLLKACPPCQGFSSLAEGRIGRDDPRNDLVAHTARFVRAFKPKAVLVENVPGLGRDRRSTELVAQLASMGYSTRTYLVNAIDFGVPQRRKRFIMLAVKGRRSKLPESLGDAAGSRVATVRDALDDVRTRAVPGDPLNEPRILTGALLDRVAAIPQGGSRFDLPEHLQLDCHKRLAAEGKSGAAGSYGRLRWNEPAPTMTTRCTTPACGPFLHPEEHRPITLREAASIQTFPPTYRFAGSRGQVERQIGNAVPVLMANGLGGALLRAIA